MSTLFTNPLCSKEELRIACIGILSLLLFFSMPAAGETATFTVTKTADTADGTCDADCSLREAVTAANGATGDDTVSIPAGTYTLSLAGSGEDSNATGDLDITDTSGTTTLQGSGASETIIDADQIDRVIHSSSGADVVINDLTISNGEIDDTGGGLRVGGDTTFTNAIISSNRATGSNESGGGVAFVNSGTLTITDSTFTGNSTEDAVGYGGALYEDNNADIVISGSTFANNVAGDNYAEGGAIYSAGDSITITDTVFTGNAGLEGGAVYLANDDAAIVRSTFTNNAATQSGGAIYNADTLTLDNSTLYGNTANGDGGGMHMTGYSYVSTAVAHTTIVGNTSDSDNDNNGDGGGLYISAGNGTVASVTIKNSIIANNASNDDGPDCAAGAGETITSADYNIIGDSTDCAAFASAANDLQDVAIQLDTDNLDDNGGPTQTVALTSSSPAVDHIPAVECTDTDDVTLTQDQRGLARPENSNCDVGAYELDQTDPVVSVTNDTAEVNTIECGVGTFSYSGATATDNSDSVFSTTVSPITSDVVDEATVGNQTVTYTATDNDANVGAAERSVTVQDTINPSITVNGDSSVSLIKGAVYVDEGATVTDACDGGVSLTTDNPVDTTTVGTYTVTYSATDASGNSTSGTRTVEVTSNTASEHGEVDQVSVDNGVITIVYEDNYSAQINPFDGDTNFRYGTTADKDVLIVTNSKVIKTYRNDQLVDRKRVYAKKAKRSKYKIKRYKLYKKKKYDSFMISSVRAGKARLAVVRVNAKGKIKKVKTRKVELPKTRMKPLRITTNRSKKRIITTYKRGATVVRLRYKLQKSGGLKLQP